jgi:nitrogen fixation NifU-like protein
MDELRELYQETILDHNKSPRNFGTLADANREAEGNNPLCGDQLRVTAIVDDAERVVDVRFEGKGCAISTASASLMTEFVKGKPLCEFRDVFERFHALVTSKPSDDVATPELGKLAVFSGVREYPVRVKCASLAWHTLRAALEQTSETAKTE